MWSWGVVAGWRERSVVLWLGLSLSVSLCLWTVNLTHASQMFLPHPRLVGKDSSHGLKLGISLPPAGLALVICSSWRHALLQRTECSGIFHSGSFSQATATSSTGRRGVRWFFLWYLLWEASQTPRSKYRRSMGAPHHWVLLECFALRLVHTESAATHRLQCRSPFLVRGSGGFSSRKVWFCIHLLVSPVLGATVCLVTSALYESKKNGCSFISAFYLLGWSWIGVF